MQRSHRSRKTPASLSDSVSKRLNMYAIAASAAGVSMSALAQPAEAKIVYTATWAEILPGATFNLDLNNDGLPDFQLSNHKSRTSYYRFIDGTMKVAPQNQGNAVWGTGGSASALVVGVTVGSSSVKFRSGHDFMANAGYSFYSGNYGSRGQWKQATGGYLGLKLTINGEIHYGWARLRVTATNRGIYAAVTGYAYETLPNTPIITGQQKSAPKTKGRAKQANREAPSTPKFTRGSLGLLAVGAPGIYAWRKRDTSGG